MLDDAAIAALLDDLLNKDSGLAGGIELTDNKLTNSGLKILSSYLSRPADQKQPTLNLIDLSRNSTTDLCDDALHYFAKAIETYPHLNVLKVNDNHNVFTSYALNSFLESLAQSPSVRVLELRGIGLNDNNAEQLQNLLRKNNTLREIDLSNNKGLSTATIQKLVDMGLVQRHSSETTASSSSDDKSVLISLKFDDASVDEKTRDTLREKLNMNLCANEISVAMNAMAVAENVSRITSARSDSRRRGNTIKQHAPSARELETSASVRQNDVPAYLQNRYLSAGRAEMKGRRPTMEDTCYIEMNFRNKDFFESYFGLFDGHGGAEVSELAAEKLHLVFSDKLDKYEEFKKLGQQQRRLEQLRQLRKQQLAASRRALSLVDAPRDIPQLQHQQNDDPDEYDDTDENLTINRPSRSVSFVKTVITHHRGSFGLNAQRPSLSELGVITPNMAMPLMEEVDTKDEGVIQDFEKLTESEAIQVLMRETFLDINTTICDANKSKRVGGSTATAVYFRGRMAYIANAGDTRVVLCRKGNPIRLSVDHRPSEPEEQDRIKLLGGFVSADNRVNGILGVSRALGDSSLLPVVTPDPYTMAIEITPDDEFMIIACDGVWDVVSDMLAVTLIHGEQDPRVAAVRLRDFAYVNGSTDNISVVVIRFDPSLSTAAVSNNNNNNNDDDLST